MIIQRMNDPAHQASEKADALREQIRSGSYKVAQEGVATAMLTRPSSRALLGCGKLSREPRAA